MVQIAKIFQLSRQVICFQRMQEHLLQVLAANTVTDGPDLRGAPRKMPNSLCMPVCIYTVVPFCQLSSKDFSNKFTVIVFNLCCKPVVSDGVSL